MNCIDIKSGSRLEMENKEMGETERDPVTGLSAKDRDAIRTSWAMVNKDAQANGTALMIRFFEEYPNNLDFFTEFRDLRPEELRDSTGLQQHAMRVMHALTCVVDSIDDAHVLIGVLHKTVDSHLTRGIRVAQFTELFDVFARFIGDVLGEKFTTDMATAWQTTAATILTVVEARMKEQLIAGTSSSSSSQAS
ncbi:globin-like [Littorina saxatilis]|uniref:Globin n=1 Tax=Littorina saxatilis TaxID=31220 RepID=A0AAN9BD58_9CAEN